MHIRSIMKRYGLRCRVIVVLLASALAPPTVEARPIPSRFVVERVVLLMRHGVRAPLNGEVPDDTRTAQAWPQWRTAESELTPHGAAALALLARYDRRWLPSLGVTRCPAAGSVRIWTNTSSRTIASGEAYAAALLPGCKIAIGHLADQQVDPIFEPLRAHATTLDPAQAIASIDRQTGGMDALVARHRTELALLDRVLGCNRGPCSPIEPAKVTASADGGGIDLTGAIRRTSGIAQVLLLQEAEGMPRKSVGWGRATPAVITRLGALHAALFDVFTRAPYMAARQASVLGYRIIATLTTEDVPRYDVMVGHDTNVTALAATLHVDLEAPGYARNDVAPGGALVIERLRERASGIRFVRLFYRAQPLAAIRALRRDVVLAPIPIPGCATQPCALDRFVAILKSRVVRPRSLDD